MQRTPPGSRGPLLALSPLRTVRPSFPRHGSSLSNAQSRTRLAAWLAFTIRTWRRRPVRWVLDPADTAGSRQWSEPLPYLRTPVSASCSSSLVMKDPLEVCPLSRGAKFEPLSNPLQIGLRFLQHPLPADPSASLAARFLCQPEKSTGLPRSVSAPFGWLRFRLFAEGTSSATDEFLAPVPDPWPFGSSLSAPLACYS